MIKFLRRGWQTISDFHWLTDRLGWLSVAIAGSGAVGIAATATEWLKPWGPLGVAACTLLALLVLVTSFLIYAAARTSIVKAALARKSMSISSINPLADEFTSAKLNVMDFFNPLYLPNKKKRLHRCQIWGPGMVIFGATNFNHCEFINCQLIILNGETSKTQLGIVGVIGFQDTVLTECELYSVTMLMSKDSYARFARNNPILLTGLPVIAGTP